MKQKFIKTTDESTAKKLLSEGFKLVSQFDNVYMFLNDASESFHFDGIDKKHIVYSNILNV